MYFLPSMCGIHKPKKYLFISIQTGILVVILYLVLVFVIQYSEHVDLDGFPWLFMGFKGFFETCIFMVGMLGIRLSKEKQGKRIHRLWIALLAMVNLKHVSDRANRVSLTLTFEQLIC